MMRVWNTVAEWQHRRASMGSASVGVVPTMGALHSGHASLVERCRRENEIAVVTIFVNPTQFNDPKDLDRYPRTYEQDLAMLRELEVDDVLAPTALEMYPHGYRYQVIARETEKLMEAAYRPGFLEGVLTVVMKLLNLAQADRAYFGEKDFQQLETVKEMVAEFFLRTEIVACPTVRTASGLAESSRNRLLSAEGLEKAAELYRVLSCADSATEALGLLEACGFRVEYVEEHWGRRLAAVYLEGIRLIDNVPLAN